MPTIQPDSPEYQEQVIALIQDIQQNEFAVAIALEDQPDLLQIPKFYQIGKRTDLLKSPKLNYLQPSPSCQ